MKRLLIPALVAVFVGAIVLTGCEPAKIVTLTQASRDVSRAANEFEIMRRIVFYNGITDTYILTIEGRCSLGISNTKLTVTCKVSDRASRSTT